MPRLLRLLPGLVLACAAFTVPSRAQEGSSGDSLAYDTALEFALRVAPEVEQFRLQEEIISARVSQADRGPNPELSLELEDMGGVYSGFSTMTSTLSLQQRLERGGKRDARRALAEAHRPMTDGERVLFENVLAHEVRDRFAAGLVAQARVALAVESRAEARDLVEIVRQKVVSGSTSPVEITRAEAWLKGTELQLTRTERDLDLARRQLLQLMGSGAPRFTRFSGVLDTLGAPGSFADSLDLIQRSPQMASLASELRIREAGLDVERAAGAPDLALAVGVRHSGDADGITFVGGVAFDLPIRDRNQGGIQAATLERNRLTSELAGMSRRMERELRDLDSRIASAQVGIRTLRREILPLYEQAAEGLRESYRLGRTTYLDVFDARRQYVEARSEELNLLLELNVLESERLRLLGRLRAYTRTP